MLDSWGGRRGKIIKGNRGQERVISTRTVVGGRGRESRNPQRLRMVGGNRRKMFRGGYR